MNAVGLHPEHTIKEACGAKDYDRAIKLAFEAYGTEILSFLCARLRSPSDGSEAFSVFAEDLCKALPSFSFRCSARGYLYTIARNAANRYASEPHNRRGKFVGVDDAELSAIIDRVRTQTELYRRSETKDKIRSLRERLSDDDQTLLTLHIDRNLPWAEIAMVMHDEDEPLSGEALTRETARLRKRFERVKDELRALAKQEGLIKG